MARDVTAEPQALPLAVDLRRAGELLGGDPVPRVTSAYRWMVLARVLDARMLALQRQGRVGFYGAATGQEAVNVALGLASRKDDWVLPGLREQLVALVRGHPLGTYVHHLFADRSDPALGRNMPCHPTARDVNYVSMSSVIGTQIAQAVGVAYGMRRGGVRAVAIGCFGDGATSSNDFHGGLNFAAVLRAPVLFCCTNNQWAISMPVEHQTAARSLAAKAAEYGLTGERVDGTDLFACWHSVASALERIRAGGPPEMLEFVLYRMTAHSSSDDPSRYQPADWAARAAAHDPVRRLERWLTEQGLLDAAARGELERAAEEAVRDAIRAAEATPPPDRSTLTADVLAPERSASLGHGGGR